MLASFFDVDVCSLATRESKLNAVGKGGRRGGPVGVLRDRLHRVTRDSCAGAACAGPKASMRPPAPRPKTRARRQFRGREPWTKAIVAVKKGRLAAPERRRIRLPRAQQASVSRGANVPSRLEEPATRLEDTRVSLSASRSPGRAHRRRLRHNHSSIDLRCHFAM